MLNLAGIIFENFLLLVLDIKNTLRAVLVNSFGFNRLETSRCEGLASMPIVLAILYDKSVSELALQLWPKLTLLPIFLNRVGLLRQLLNFGLDRETQRVLLLARSLLVGAAAGRVSFELVGAQCGLATRNSAGWVLTDVGELHAKVRPRLLKKLNRIDLWLIDQLRWAHLMCAQQVRHLIWRLDQEIRFTYLTCGWDLRLNNIEWSAKIKLFKSPRFVRIGRLKNHICWSLFNVHWAKLNYAFATFLLQIHWPLQISGIDRLLWRNLQRARTTLITWLL